MYLLVSSNITSRWEMESIIHLLHILYTLGYEEKLKFLMIMFYLNKKEYISEIYFTASDYKNQLLIPSSLQIFPISFQYVYSFPVPIPP